MSNTDHLNDQTLNEFLDGALSSRALAAAQQHLKDCEVCARRLGEISDIFAMLEGLPEDPLRRDLSSGIVEAIRMREASPKRTSWKPNLGLGLGLAAETLAALALLALAWSEAQSWLALVPLPDFTGPFSTALEGVGVFLSALFASPDPFGLGTLPAMITAPTIPWASVSSLITLLAASTLVWLLGNGLLIRRGPLAANRRER
jgi:Putative zinc-finger